MAKISLDNDKLIEASLDRLGVAGRKLDKYIIEFVKMHYKSFQINTEGIWGPQKHFVDALWG